MSAAGCCCGHDCLPPEEQDAALRAVWAEGGRYTLHRVLVLLRALDGRTVDAGLAALLAQCLRLPPTPEEQAGLEELGAQVNARESEGFADA